MFYRYRTNPLFSALRMLLVKKKETKFRNSKEIFSNLKEFSFKSKEFQMKKSETTERYVRHTIALKF